MNHLVIPDTQIKPDVDITHLTWIGRYIVDKKPEKIIMLGDWYDMPSLSRWDSVAKKVLTARDVHADIVAGNRGWDLLMAPIFAYNKSHRRKYKPEMTFLYGNHENRIARAINDEPWLRGLFDATPMKARAYGWKVVPFLTPIEIDSIRYCHYFVRNANGSVTQSKRGMPSAKSQVIREAMSATAGHKQGLDVHVQPAGGRLLRGLIAGSCYSHDEEYLTAQGNEHFRGVIMKHDVRDYGYYDLCEVSLEFLRRRWS